MNPIHLLFIPARQRRKRTAPSEETKMAIAAARSAAWTPAARASHAAAVTAAATRRHAAQRGPDGMGRLRPPSTVRHTAKPAPFEVVTVPCQPGHYAQPVLTPAQLTRLCDWQLAAPQGEALVVVPAPDGATVTLHGWRRVSACGDGSTRVNVGRRWLVVALMALPVHVAGVSPLPVALVTGPVKTR